MYWNWMQSLLDTYDECIQGIPSSDDSSPLIPPYFTGNAAHIAIAIDSEGKFIKAEVVPKENQFTVIPCTEESAWARTSGLRPHPLVDKLMYLAPDFNLFSIEEKERKGSPFEMYVNQLTEWCESNYSNPKARAVLAYISAGTIIDDLVKSGCLVLGEDGRFASRKECPDAPLVKKAKIQGKQEEAFVRWIVDIPGDACVETWNDQSIVRDWTEFVKSDSNRKLKTGLCFLSGEETNLARYHPNKIRNSGDSAKIISSNDKTGFTYRGRFESEDQVCGLGIEESQKIHSALRWLIDRQGYQNGDLCIVSWTTSGNRVTSPVEGIYDILERDNESSQFTNEEVAKHLKSRLRGYNSEILTKDVMIMALNSAQSRQGRLAITMFRCNLGEDFVKAMERWHGKCAWIHKYVKVKDGDKSRDVTFVGAPAPKDIALAAYGRNADDKVISTVIERMLPCILDSERIPRDIVESVVRRASNPVAMEPWEWRKTLSIACSVYKGYTGGEYEMVLETERKSRDYLYGRLLAIADLMEEQALKSAGENRQTTAVRLMQRFSERPYDTWRNIELALQPYASRLGSKSHYYESKISKIMDMFEGDDFRSDARLSGEFLLAYHCQREEQFRKKEEKSEETQEE